MPWSSSDQRVRFRWDMFNVTNTPRFDVGAMDMLPGHRHTFGRYNGTLATCDGGAGRCMQFLRGTSSDGLGVGRQSVARRVGRSYALFLYGCRAARSRGVPDSTPPTCTRPTTTCANPTTPQPDNPQSLQCPRVSHSPARARVDPVAGLRRGDRARVRAAAGDAAGSRRQPHLVGRGVPHRPGALRRRPGASSARISSSRPATRSRRPTRRARTRRSSSTSRTRSCGRAGAASMPTTRSTRRARPRWRTRGAWRPAAPSSSTTRTSGCTPRRNWRPSSSAASRGTSRT